MSRAHVVLLVAVLGLLGGCHSGEFAKRNTTQVVLTGNNYRVLQTGVKGSDTGLRVFGIGSSARYAVALGKIRILAELDDRPRALINITEDHQGYYLGIVSRETRCG